MNVENRILPVDAVPDEPAPRGGYRTLPHEQERQRVEQMLERRYQKHRDYYAQNRSAVLEREREARQKRRQETIAAALRMKNGA